MKAAFIEQKERKPRPTLYLTFVAGSKVIVPLPGIPIPEIGTIDDMLVRIRVFPEI